MIWLVVVLVFLLISALFELVRTRRTNFNLHKKIDKVLETNKKIASELASIRVKHGQTWETFLPLMETFELQLGPKENAVFLGQPLDLIYFNDDEIVFVEVKTGNSRLSSKQRHIRDLVKERKIRWEEVNDALRHALPGTDRTNSVAMMKTIPHRSPPNELSEQQSNN